MFQVFEIVFPIFAIVALGYLYARRFGPDMASANRLNLEIFTPALIFSVLSGEGFELARYADIALAAMLVVLGSGPSGFLASSFIVRAPRCSRRPSR